MNKRMKEAREARKLSQLKTAELIGITSSGYSKLEKGTNNPSDRTIALFCQQLSISESWLRTGEGEMEEAEPLSVAEQLAREHDLSPAKVVLLRAIERAFRELPEDEFQRIMDRMIDEMHALAARRASDEPPS